MGSLHARPRYRRSWKRKLLIAFNIVLATLMVIGISGLGYAKWRFGQINKVDVSDALDQSDDGPQSPMTVLLVGSDSRANLAAGEANAIGGANATPGLADTMMLLHIDPKTEQASILSLPRDTWVTIAGTNGHAKLNSAFAGGGVAGITRLIKTINQNFGVSIDHYAQVDFDGFKGIVNAVDGVSIPFAAPARDWGFDEKTGTTRNLSGLDVKTTGCVKLDGTQALAYARSRHYQAFIDGQWVSDPQSDITRIQRQQDFVRRVMRKAVSNATNPVALNSMLSAGVKNLTIDNTFSPTDIQRLAKRYKSLDPSKVEMMTLPTKGAMINGASVLQVQEPAAQQTIARFLQTQTQTAETPNIPPSSISIRVTNASGIPGAAASTASDLRTTGFGVLGIGTVNTQQQTTSIRYGSGQKDKAQVIATYIPGATLVEDTTLRGVDAVVVLGKSFTGVVGGAASSTTTTTVPGTTSTSTTTTAPSKFVPDPTNTCA